MSLLLFCPRISLCWLQLTLKDTYCDAQTSSFGFTWRRLCFNVLGTMSFEFSLPLHTRLRISEIGMAIIEDCEIRQTFSSPNRRLNNTFSLRCDVQEDLEKFNCTHSLHVHSNLWRVYLRLSSPSIEFRSSTCIDVILISHRYCALHYYVLFIVYRWVWSVGSIQTDSQDYKVSRGLIYMWCLRAYPSLFRSFPKASILALSGLYYVRFIWLKNLRIS